MLLRDLGWTPDFEEFKAKTESLFGPLEELAETAPDVYAHMVLSHGFMEYAHETGLQEKIKTEIAGSGDKFREVIIGPNTPEKESYRREYDQRLKKEYMDWAKSNSLPGHLLEDGWHEFLND